VIEKWLASIVDGAKRDAGLGLEIARCGRLIKGYGATNERGKTNLLHVLDHLAKLPDAKAAARAIADAREAALADEAGKALDAALVAHGAPPRPVPEQPIRFVRRVKPPIPDRAG
jgi:indolepyruvate ferredoxin oxidoreductase beta subunit